MRPPLAFDSTPDAAPRSHLRGPWLWAGVGIGLVLLLALRLVYQIFQDVADGNPGEIPERVFEELTGIALAVPLIVGAVRLVQRVPVVQRRWWRPLLVHGAAFVAVSTVHTTAMLLVRGALAPRFGFDGYVPRFTIARYAYEGANDVLPIAVLLGSLALADHLLAARARERRAAALERSLLDAELRGLRLQLQPHFLFNALNTISSTMYDDPAAADALLGRLSELLRTSLRTTHAHEVALRDELALLDQYLGLMRARFGDRLTVHVDASPSAGACLVPSMLLQPLVENAVRHGGVGTTGRGLVRVRIARLGHELELRVHDDGPGVVAARDPLATGTGLAATARRLQLLYGDAHALRAGNAPDGGFEVVVRIPARETAATTSATSGAPRAAAGVA
ncbi:MAG: sensor histidine kinase [Gemmatirosa sp.]